MSDAIADAPVRANRAPTRPKTASPAAPSKPVREDTEATLLVRRAAKNISDLLVPISGNWPWDLASTPGREFIASADTQVYALSKSEDDWGKEEDEPPRPAIPEHLAQIAGDLWGAMSALSAPTEQPGQNLVLRLLVENACDIVEQLREAHAGLPGTMEELRALATFAGIRPHREQPRPPIRRVEGEDGKPLKAASNVLFDIECKRGAAAHVLSEWAEHANIPAAFGLVTLMKQLEKQLDLEQEQPDLEDPISGSFPRISAEVLVVSDVAHAVVQQNDDVTLHAVTYLLDMCKQIADDYCDDLMAARTSQGVSHG